MYDFAKFLDSRFKSLIENRSTFSIKNSLELVEKIEDVNPFHGSTLVFYDVKSLFPDILSPLPHFGHFSKSSRWD